MTLLLAVVSIAATARYTVHNVTGQVTIESRGKTVAATKGLQVNASDLINIPAGAEVEIYNELDKRIYTSVKSGRFTVTRLMIDARGVASDNSANVASRMRFGAKDKGDEQRRVYVEKGMVRRSLAVYDPEGEGVQMDAVTLGRFLAARLRSNGLADVAAPPVKVEHSGSEETGLTFRVENTLDFPVYFNIIRLKGSGNGDVEISPVGQPAGSYVLLPRQSLSREHFSPLGPGEKHVLVMTHCQYDIDEVIEEMAKAAGTAPRSNDGEALPVYTVTL